MTANTYLTPTAVLRRALMVLHQKCNFIGTIDRQYDSKFANSGGKIGDNLTIRLPNQFTFRRGRTLQPQVITEPSVVLTVADQGGTDMNFTSADLTLDIEDFSSRFIEPAINVIAANLENDAMAMYKDIYNETSDVGATATLALVLDASKRLTDNLATKPWTLNMRTNTNADLVNVLSNYFNPAAQQSKQYRDGVLQADFMGFAEVYQNTLWPIHTTGTDDGTGDYLINGANQTGASITVGTGAGTFLKGDVIFITGVNRVHPETKADTGRLQQFVVTADTTVSATSISISPSIVTSGAYQNVTGSPADAAPVLKIESDQSTAIGASADYDISLCYAKQAFAFATADLEMPKGVDFSAREVLDGISMRIVRQYDVNNDAFPCRIDVLYGYKTVRPQLAARLGLH